MDVPRVRYECCTRRVGSSPPVADAGPNQIGITAGTVTLDGSASYDPVGDRAHLSVDADRRPERDARPRQPRQRDLHRGRRPDLRLPPDGNRTRTACPGSRNDHGVDRALRRAAQVVQFTATPSSIRPARVRTLTWIVQGATSVYHQHRHRHGAIRDRFHHGDARPRPPPTP